MSKAHQGPVDETEQMKDLTGQSTFKIWLLAGLLIIVCTAVIVSHWPALSTRTMFLDDSQYLTENLLVQNPSWTSVRCFFTEVLEPSTVDGYYQPLAMISLMVDYSLGGRGDDLRPFRRTSLALHAANTALVTVLLYLLFGRVWAAAAAGLLFGLHPMTVESICWLSDRKTLLATFFALWSLIIYVRFVHRGNLKLYGSCLVMYVLALMSKPTSLFLPVLMLLMDYWPLGRLKKGTILEKLPFFTAGVIFAVITYISQSRTSTLIEPSGYDFEHILLVFCHNIVFYLYKIIWPINLSAHYPFPEPLGLSQPMVLAGVIGTSILIALLLISLRWTRALLTGWLFFLIAILPTTNVVGFTDVIAADKYAYLPSIGLLMVLVSFLGKLCSNSKSIARQAAVIIIVLVLAGAESFATRRYLVHWRDSISLNEYMLKLTPNAAPLHYELGYALQLNGEFDQAISQYNKTLQINPNYVRAHNNLGIMLLKQGKSEEAINHFRQAIQRKPRFFKSYYNLGTALLEQGDFVEAISYFRQAIQINPRFFESYNNLAWVLATHPDPKLRDALEAIELSERAAKLTRYQDAAVLDTLAASYAAAGRFEQAVTTAQMAMVLVATGDKEMANKIRGRLELYRQGKPYQAPVKTQGSGAP